MDLLFIPGKSYLATTSTVLSLLGLVLVIQGGIIIQYTGGVYAGAWYLGIFNILAGFRGTILKTSFTVRLLQLFSGLSFVVAVVASVLLYRSYVSLTAYTACASFDGSYQVTDSCAVSSNFTCVGDRSYFPNVTACEISFVESTEDDDIFTSSLSTQCECITTSYHCKSFLTAAGTCGVFLHTVPANVLASFALSIVSAYVSLMLNILCYFSLYRPTIFLSQGEIDMQQTLLFQEALEVIASIEGANNEPPAVLAEATVAAPSAIVLSSSTGDGNTDGSDTPGESCSGNVNDVPISHARIYHGATIVPPVFTTSTVVCDGDQDVENHRTLTEMTTGSDVEETMVDVQIVHAAGETASTDQERGDRSAGDDRNAVMATARLI